MHSAALLLNVTFPLCYYLCSRSAPDSASMGCIFSSRENEDDDRQGPVDVASGIGRVKKWTKGRRWQSEEPLTVERLKRMRDEFWDTQPAYGGNKVIWDALKAVCETDDLQTGRVIIESAGIIVAAPDLSICYDERGAKYELPPYVLCDPVNLVRDTPPGASHM